jgi:hypothetical protein
LFASPRDPRIDALVELGGSMRYYPGLVTRAGNVGWNRLRESVLNIFSNRPRGSSSNGLDCN